MLRVFQKPQSLTGNLKTCAPARTLDALDPNPPELAVVLEPVKAWPGNAARVESYARRPALTGLCARRPPEYAGRDEGMAPQGAEQKDGCDQSTPFGMRKWRVRKCEHTWVRFRERRGTDSFYRFQGS